MTVLDVRDRDEFERWHLTGDGIEPSRSRT